jgi:hypothetical protein
MREPNPFQQDGTWWNNRLGKLTGSRMAAAMNFLKSGKESSERENLRYEVVAERITNTFADKYMTSDMQWGVDQECAAKEAFENITGLMVKDVGFVDHPSIFHCGVSPDGYVSDGSLIEVKCPKTKTHMKYVANQVIPAEYKPQMLLQSACTGKDVWFVSYDPRFPEEHQVFTQRVERDDARIAELEKDVAEFLAEAEADLKALNEG